jgi:hypothetical protein
VTAQKWNVELECPECGALPWRSCVEGGEDYGFQVHPSRCHTSTASLLITAAIKAASEDGDPIPTDAVAASARLVYRELHKGGLDASDLTHDALGGLAFTIGDSKAFAWVAIMNNGARVIRFVGHSLSGTESLGTDYVSRIKSFMKFEKLLSWAREAPEPESGILASLPIKCST